MPLRSHNKDSPGKYGFGEAAAGFWGDLVFRADCRALKSGKPFGVASALGEPEERAELSDEPSVHARYPGT